MRTPTSITFFATEEAATKMAELNGGEAEGFIAVPSSVHPGKFAVQVWDTDIDLFLGYL